MRRRVRACGVPACVARGEGGGVAAARGLCGLRRVEPDHSLVPAGRRPPLLGRPGVAPPPPVLCVLAGDSGTDAQRRCRRTAPSPRARRRLPRTGALAPAGLSARAPTMRHRCFLSSTVWAMLWNLCLCLGVAMGRSAAASLTTMGMMSLVFVPCSPSTVVCRGGGYAARRYSMPHAAMRHRPTLCGAVRRRPTPFDAARSRARRRPGAVRRRPTPPSSVPRPLSSLSLSRGWVTRSTQLLLSHHPRPSSRSQALWK